MQEKTVQKLTKFALVIFLLSVPFSFVYSPLFEINKSYTSFSLYNIYLIDVAALFLASVTLLSSYWHKKSFLTPLLLFPLFAFLSSLWSGSPFLSSLWGLRLLLIISALLITVRLIRGKTYYRDLFFKIFIAAGVLESIIALGQFIFQRSLGLYLLGESRLGQDILGLTRVDILGHNLLRAYGTFPHPNVLGGFLLFTIAATIWAKPAKYYKLILIIQIIGLTLTFSRSAILGLSLILFLIFFSSRVFFAVIPSERSESRDPFRISKKGFLHYGRRWRPSVGMTTAVVLIIFSIFILRSPIQKILNGTDPAIHLRVEYAKASYHRFIDSPVLGRGWGTGPIELPAYSTFPFYSWELQPVHNIYLLVLSDLGIIGLLIFLYFIWRIFFRRNALRRVPTMIWQYLFIAYLFIGLFDHYLLTLPQGIFIFFASALLASGVLEQKTEKTPPRG